MTDPTTTAETQTAGTPPDSTIPDDLRVGEWLYASDPELELDAGDTETVGDVRQAYHDVYLSDPDSYSQAWSPAIFAAGGRVYAAEIGVVVRPATPEEVREAVEEVRASTLDTARARVETLDRYLIAPAT